MSIFPKINNYLYIDESSKSIKDFIDLIHCQDFRKVRLLLPQVILGKSVITPVTRTLESSEDFKDYKVSLCGTKMITQGDITLTDIDNYPDIFYINRQYKKKNIIDKKLLFGLSSTEIINEDYGSNFEDPDVCRKLLNNPSKNSTYYNNLELEKVESLLLKETKRSEVHLDVSNGEDIMPGINTPMFYLASNKSFSEIHVEDADLASMNIIQYNIASINNYQQIKRQPAKLWLIVPEKNKLFHELNKCLQSCQFQPMHKNLYVTPTFLERKSIKYFCVLQYPGDIIFLKSSIFHQVLNLVPNFAEAINYGTLEWLVQYKGLLTCDCDDNEYDMIRPDSKAIVKIVKKKSTTFHVCPQPNCDGIFFNLDEWGTHLHNDHNISKPFQCNVCSKNFTNRKSKTQHFCSPDINTDNEFKQTCSLCNVKVKYMMQHIKSKKHLSRSSHAASSTSMNHDNCNRSDGDSRNMLIARRRCYKCKRCCISMDKLEKHEKNCNPIICDQCNKAFANKWSLSRHLDSQHS